MYESLELADTAVAVFLAPLQADSAQLSRIESWLRADELERGSRFVTTELQNRFKICRGMLRWLLGQITDSAPEQIQLEYGQWGKPGVKLSPLQSPIHFNVSHSLDWAMFAFARSPIGIDLEVWQERIKYRSIASQILAVEEQPVFDTLPAKDHAQTILELWVCKESLLKAMGLGIAEGLKKTAFRLPIPSNEEFSPSRIDPTLQLHIEDDASCRMNHWTDAECWRTRLLNLDSIRSTANNSDPSLFAALTCMPHIDDIRLKTLECADLT